MIDDSSLGTVIITERDDAVVIGEATGALYPGPTQGPAGPKGDAGPVGSQGPPGESYRVVDTPPSPYACVDRDEVWWTTSAAPVMQVLPANPSPGTRVRTIRSGGNTVTIQGNGNTIAGSASSLVIDQDNVGVEFAWDAAVVTWVVVLIQSCRSTANVGTSGYGLGNNGGGSNGAAQTYAYPFSGQATWSIPHRLGRFPSVTTVQTSGDQVFGDLTYLDANTLQIAFTVPVSGTAYLN